MLCRPQCWPAGRYQRRASHRPARRPPL